MKTINLLILCVSMLLNLSLHAQECFWAAQAGGSGQDDSGPLATDHIGNTYVSGKFTSSPCYFQTVTLLCHGYNDVFIAKYDPSGSEVWVKQFYAGWSNKADFSGSSLDNDLIITGMVFDSLDHTLLATGTFFQHMMLPNFTIVYGRHFDVFVMKMDLDGNILWIKTAGSEFEDLSMGITYDEQENVYISGSNSFAATFGDTIISQGGFIAKYDKNGNFLWAQNKFRYYDYWPSPIYTEAPPLYLDFYNQHLIVYGSVINDSLVLDTITLSGLWGFNASYLASFSPDGEIQWLTKVGGSPFQIATKGQISIDISGNIYLTGTFKIIGIYGDDTLTTSGNDVYDFSLTKVSPNGSFLWALQGYSTLDALGYVTICDKPGNVYSGGYFVDSITFGGQTLVSNSPNDMFVVSYSSDGSFRGTLQYSDGVISGMAFDLNGNLVFGGAFANVLTIGSKSLTSHGLYDAFAAKCSPITSTKEPPPAPSNQLSIYANPNTGKCNITIPEEFRHEEELTLYIYDSQGKLIQKAALDRNEETYRLDIRAQAAGIYQAILTDGTRQYAGKIVFEKN